MSAKDRPGVDPSNKGSANQSISEEPGSGTSVQRAPVTGISGRTPGASSGLNAWLAIGLICLSNIVVELALLPPEAPAWEGWAWGFLSLGLTGGLYLGLRSWGQFDRPPSGFWALIFVVAALWPIAWDPFSRAYLSQGRPAELLGLSILRAMGLVAAALAGWQRYMHLAAMMSIFLVLFGLTMAQERSLLPVLCLYAVTAVVFLMHRHWDRLNLHRSLEQQRSLPLFPALLLGVLLVAVVAWTDPHREDWGRPLLELLPGSGGTSWHDPYGRGGLGDGDDVASSPDPTSTGSVGEVFIESPELSLYDAINDQYGEPFVPNQRRRAVALDPDLIRELKESARNNQARREFSTRRRSPRGGQPPDTLPANALLSIQGPTPLHIRLVAFDRFDGQVWYQAPDQDMVCVGFQQLPDRSLLLQLQNTQVLDTQSQHAEVDHKVLLGKLRTSVLPVPNHLVRFRLGLADRPNFYRWGQEGVLRLADRDGRIPQGEVIETTAAVYDRLQLVDRSVMPFDQSVPLTENCQQIVQQWTAGSPRGWQQVEQVISRLRADYQLDPAVTVPEEATNSLEYFLLESRRGPDYLFASAAAATLQHLGYRARLVTGYHAGPEDYDPASRYSLLGREDLHSWAEVQLADGRWITLEPSPGYGILQPPRSWLAWISHQCALAAQWLLRNSVLVTTIGIVLGMVFWQRSRLQAGMLTGLWILASYWRPRQSLRWTLWLLERRAELVGLARPPGRTLSAWYGQLSRQNQSQQFQSVAADFLTLVERACYSPAENGKAGGVSDQTRATCQRLARTWTCRQMARAVGSHSTLWAGEPSWRRAVSWMGSLGVLDRKSPPGDKFVDDSPRPRTPSNTVTRARVVAGSVAGEGVAQGELGLQDSHHFESRLS